MPLLTQSRSVSAPAHRRVRSVSDALAPLDEIAAHSESLVVQPGAEFEVNGEPYVLPRYLFIGPQGGDVPIRIGLFAGIHGDEPEGTYALVRFLRLLAAHPEIAKGYSLSVYPVCNPTGFQDDTRHSRSGKDLNREFWRQSPEPEVRLLQAEITSRSFHGIISLHTDDTCEGFYGIVRGATLTEHLIEPALSAAELFLPRDERSTIDGFQARRGVILDCYQGVLSAPPKVRPRPFEIILETPKAAPAFLTECAFTASLQTILQEYRKFIAFAPNL
ncbi:MAG: succinylglutamate desuccinylase/aspartoacylase family protein [Verrucomicrobiota bacterium]